jgi:hypothetical protein
VFETDIHAVHQPTSPTTSMGALVSGTSSSISSCFAAVTGLAAGAAVVFFVVLSGASTGDAPSGLTVSGDALALGDDEMAVPRSLETIQASKQSSCLIDCCGKHCNDPTDPTSPKTHQWWAAGSSHPLRRACAPQCWAWRSWQRQRRRGNFGSTMRVGLYCFRA